MIIVDVDYRLAPEYPFPTQIWDAWQALKWVFDKATELGIDKSRVSIGGLSAGGHLAAVLAHLARDEKDMPPLKLQLLVVPSVDGRFIPLEGSPDPAVPYKTYISCEYAPCLPMNRMRWFSRHWLGSDVGMSPIGRRQWNAHLMLMPSRRTKEEGRVMAMLAYSSSFSQGSCTLFHPLCRIRCACRRRTRVQRAFEQIRNIKQDQDL